MGWRFLAVLVTYGSALECQVGRVHDADLRAHSNSFVDGVAVEACPAGTDSCCVTFEASRCCTLAGRTYAVSDGACGSALLCGNVDGAADGVCAAYEVGRRGRCAYATCRGGGCNAVGGFDLGADDAASRASVAAGVLAAVFLVAG
jgi:hypothetical protein